MPYVLEPNQTKKTAVAMATSSETRARLFDPVPSPAVQKKLATTRKTKSTSDTRLWIQWLDDHRAGALPG